jgi:3-hydroxybutyryl-CoA dehydrogenase
MKLGANHPMGPLALGDLIGLDVVLAIMETLYRETADSKYRPALLLKKMVRFFINFLLYFKQRTPM